MARAGGILLHHKDYLYMICGEIKPGIRTPKLQFILSKKKNNFKISI